MTSTEWGEHFRHLVKMWAGMGNHSGGLYSLYLCIEHGSSRGGPRHARASLHQDGRGLHEHYLLRGGSRVL